MNYKYHLKKQAKLLPTLLTVGAIAATTRRYFDPGWEGSPYSWETIIVFCITFVLFGSYARYKKWFVDDDSDIWPWPW